MVWSTSSETIPSLWGTRRLLMAISEDFTAAEVEVETFMEQELPAPSQMMPETSPIMLSMQWLICSNWPPAAR